MLKATDLLRALRVRSLKPRQAETIQDPVAEQEALVQHEILVAERPKSLLR